MDTANMNGDASSRKLWIGIAVGAAVGLGIALSRRRRSRWDAAKNISKRLSDKSEDLADVTRDIVERVKTIVEESKRVVDDAGDLWIHGRKLVGRA